MKCHITPAQMREVVDLGWDPHGDLGRVAWLISEVRRLRAMLPRLDDLYVNGAHIDAGPLDGFDREGIAPLGARLSDTLPP